MWKMRIKDLVKLEVRKLQKLTVVGRDGMEGSGKGREAQAC